MLRDYILAAGSHGNGDAERPVSQVHPLCALPHL
jgi:hypothetical protein